MAQSPAFPDIQSQRSAMSALKFLAGRWSGEARIFRESGNPLELIQTEEVQYKLGGLVLIIEGIGRNKADGKLVLQALAIISYDDEARRYRMRAYNDGRYLETDLELIQEHKGVSWGFVVGGSKTSSVLRVDENGTWTESTQITIGSQPSRILIELAVSLQSNAA
jgi:hypothetical protein